jgi:hypothetical protein
MYKFEERNLAAHKTGQYPIQYTFEGNAKHGQVGTDEMYMLDEWHREIDGIVYPLTPYVHPDWNTLKHWHPWPWRIGKNVFAIDIEPYLEEAMTLVGRMPKAPKGSLMQGESTLSGMLGEIIIREHLKSIEVPVIHESTSDYDLLIGDNRKRVDVKTKGAAWPPKAEWDCSIPQGADGPDFACPRRTTNHAAYRPTMEKHLDAFSFVRIETPKRRKVAHEKWDFTEPPAFSGKDPHGEPYHYMRNAWILGQLSYRDFYMNAFPILADEKDRRRIAMGQQRPYQSRFDQWNIYHHQLDLWWEPDTRGGEMVLKKDYLEILCS